MSAFTLDNIRAAADAKYAATEIAVDENTTVRLLNPLRLKKADREALQEVQTSVGEGADQGDVFRAALRIVAEDKDVELLIDAIGDDLAVLAQVFETYMTGTSAGEA